MQATPHAAAKLSLGHDDLDNRVARCCVQFRDHGLTGQLVAIADLVGADRREEGADLREVALCARVAVVREILGEPKGQSR